MQQSQFTIEEALERFSGRRFNSYAAYFKRIFGSRVQKLAINAGFTCPNRDGRVGTGGCTFCNNSAFTPSYCQPQLSVGEQIAEAVEFHKRRYRRAAHYLAYFQSFSNTYAPLDELRELYGQALAHPDVVGVVIGTRPDCVDESKLDYLAELAQSKYVAIEYGVESCFDATLERINRGHTFEQSRWAIEQSAARGLNCGAHFILGLPGESDDMLREQVAVINSLPLTTVKFHQLQIFRDTPMQWEYCERPDDFRFWELEEYISLFIDIVEKLNPSFVVERFVSEAPPRYQFGPQWGVRNDVLLARFERELELRNTYQGCNFKL